MSGHAAPRRDQLARIAIDSLSQFIAVLDNNGIVLEINRAATDAVGARVNGEPLWAQVPSEISARMRESIARASGGETVCWQTPFRERTGDSELLFLELTFRPIRGDDGAVQFICAESRDVTEKRARERELGRLHERIRELDELKAKFFANVSHELRTPLALILGPAQRLIDDEGGLSVDERRESGQVVARNARLLLKHVNDLLDMSKLEARKLDIERQDGDVAKLVRYVASHFAVLAAERRIELVVDADATCMAAFDGEKLQRVLVNLLGNAFKFVPSPGRIRCALRQSANEFTITVDDSGPGVRPELRSAIFERFRQGEGEANGRAGGTGLGLAIAKEFVELHGGLIVAYESELGGACFEVALPLSLVGVAATDAPPDRTMLDAVVEELRFAAADGRSRESRPPAAPGRPRVLVVEDNPDMNRFITQCLSRRYDVESAFDGAEGLAKALAFRPMLVISDIMMPKVSGVELIAEMRKLPELRQTPVLLLSAKADEDLMVKLLDDGAQDFIIKPFSEKELIVRVGNLVLTQQAREATTQSLAREHQAREEAELQKRLLYSLFMQAPTLIAVLRGEEHIVELANPPICEVWGKTQAELYNRPLLEAMPELRDQIVPGLLDEVYATGVPAVGRETPARFVRGGEIETVYFNYVYSPFRGVDGAVDGVFVLASDVTAQVLAREQVDGLRDAAEGANRAKDEFLAMLGHELRNPLSPILTALHVMKTQGAGSERERTIIERQVRHLARLVDDLLDVSRIASGRVELRTELVELGDVVAKAIELASPLLEQRKHTLRVDVPADGLPVDGDATRLSQVVSNLLTNAAKYTSPGGQIFLHAHSFEDEIVLTVRDTGIGIAPDVLPRVFEMFVQARQTIDRSLGGLGIGLTIVRSLVERHGGYITAHSEGPGRGSEFVVRLPLASVADELAPTTERGSQSSVGTRGTRILVVDDNEDAAELLSLALTVSGYEARVAHDGPTALQIAAEFSPRAALLDIGLPVMDGYELAANLRALPGLSEVRLIALTGYGQDSDRARSREAGFHHHLVKPVDLDDVEATLRASLSPAPASEAR